MENSKNGCPYSRGGTTEITTGKTATLPTAITAYWLAQLLSSLLVFQGTSLSQFLRLQLRYRPTRAKLQHLINSPNSVKPTSKLLAQRAIITNRYQPARSTCPASISSACSPFIMRINPTIRSCAVTALTIAPGSRLTLQLFPNFFNLRTQIFILSYFASQKALGQRGFVFNAGRRQDVQIAGFFLAFAEVFGFDQAFFDQGLQAEVDLAQTQAQLFGQLALADVRIVLKAFENLVAGVVGQHVLILVGRTFLLGELCSMAEHNSQLTAAWQQGR